MIKIRATLERANGGWNQGTGGLTGIRNSDVEVEKLAGPPFWTSREAERAVHLYAPQPFCMEPRVCHTFGQKMGISAQLRKEILLTEEEGEARDEDGRQDPRAEGQDGLGRRRRRRRGTASR